MRRIWPACVLALVAFASGAEEVTDGIAAQVGSDVVLVSEVSRLAAPLEAQMRAAGAQEPEVARLRAEMLERVIERRLIAQVARKSEIEASEAEVDQAIAAIAAENRLDADEVKRRVEAEGLPFEAYRQRLAEEIVHQKVLAAMVQSRVHVDESEIRSLYDARYGGQRGEGEEVHLRHLVVPPDGDGAAAREEACRLARQARDRIGAGESLSAVAADLAASRRIGGGDLGWVHLADLADWMKPAVAELSPGGVSPVIETPFGCALLELAERRGTRLVSYEEARGELRSRLFEQRFAEEYMSFVEKLREKTYIERKGLFAEAARLGAGAGVEPTEPRTPPAVP
jgi:peptidyl-prolyl cis-trans isomerase SurA